MDENVLRVAIVDPDDLSRASMKNMLLGVESLWLEADCSRYEFFIDVLDQATPDIAIVSLDADPVKGLSLIQQVSRQLPTCAVLAVSGSQEGSLILQAMRNGAREFLNYPLQLEDILAALDRVRSAPSGLASGSTMTRIRSSRVIAVAGVEGGVGCTSLAVNLACMLARHESNSVTILDLDLSLGDADVWLDLLPDYTIQDLAENIQRIDYSLLKRSLTRHECGAYLLPRPVQMSDRNSVNGESLKRVISLLKSTFSHLILDLSKNYGELEMAALESADTILLLTQLDLPGLRNVVRLNQFFDEYEGINDKVRVILNRMGIEETQISMSKAKETIEREIFCQLPNDYQAMVDSRNNGVPLMLQAPKARITKAIEAIAEVFHEGEPGEETPKKPKKGLFSFLSNG
ncbi:MAG: AAA family ATPase [Planctomycetaceae bacterium]|jgi:pilus assembly protein CpaE|nr:AAA family ATPase [Planctomycetaceae bacterium]MDC0308241.1 AAA family ATPase [Planctomycetaceae bacterium]MDG2390736.1 AAA family ATPase [Planctomycetaceae bacterium]